MNKIIPLQKINPKLYKKADKLAKKQGSVFLPNPIFTKRPKYILIAMEPSMRNSLSKMKEYINNGGVNFMGKREDIILHYCAYRFLCKNKFKYYITDLSKAPIKGKAASKNRFERYDKWFKILQDEIKFFKCKKLIAIGKTSVLKYLKQKKSNCPYIYHYSWKARNSIKNYCNKNNIGLTNVTIENIKNFQLTLYQKTNIEIKIIEKRIKRNFNKRLSKPQKLLISYYKHEFEKIKRAS